MEDLTDAWRKRDDGKDKSSIKDDRWVNTLPSVLEILKKLNLLKENQKKKENAEDLKRRKKKQLKISILSTSDWEVITLSFLHFSSSV